MGRFKETLWKREKKKETMAGIMHKIEETLHMGGNKKEEHKGEYHGEHKGEPHKGEYHGENKGEPHKGEYHGEHKGEYHGEKKGLWTRSRTRSMVTVTRRGRRRRR